MMPKSVTVGLMVIAGLLLPNAVVASPAPVEELVAKDETFGTCTADRACNGRGTCTAGDNTICCRLIDSCSATGNSCSINGGGVIANCS